MVTRTSQLEGLKVCFIFPNVALERTAALLQNVHALGPIQPMSLLYAAGIVEAAGAEVRLIDGTGNGLTKEDVIEQVKEFGPDVLAYTIATLDFAFSVEWIEDIRKECDLPVLVGGIHLSQFPLETLTHKCIDWGVVTDGEVTAVELLKTWQAGEDLSKVRGIVYRNDEGVPTMTESRATWVDVDETAWPARHLVNLDAYWSVMSRRKRFTAMMTGFGCPLSCTFCVLTEVPFRQRSPKSIADEMEYCYEELGIEEFDFFDPNFTFGKKRTRAICQEIIDRGLHKKVIWSPRARSDKVTKDIVELMAEAGCSQIRYGFDSGDPEILHNAQKWQGGLDSMRDAVGWARDAGMEVLGFFTLGNPGETHETIARSKAFVLSLDLDFIQVAPIFMLPGSPMYNTHVERTGDDFWRQHTLDLKPLDALPFLDTELTTEELKAAALDIYRSFYLRPRTYFRAATWRRVWNPTIRKRVLAARRML